MGISSSPQVYNVTLTSANTEYNQALPTGTKRFMFKCRTAYAVKLAFTEGESGTTYFTVPANMAYREYDLSLSGTRTLYFQSTTAGVVVEIIAWV